MVRRVEFVTQVTATGFWLESPHSAKALLNETYESGTNWLTMSLGVGDAANL